MADQCSEVLSLGSDEKVAGFIKHFTPRSPLLLHQVLFKTHTLNVTRLTEIQFQPTLFITGMLYLDSL